MASGDDNPEYITFHNNLGLISKTISPVLPEFVAKSFEKDLISDAFMERQSWFATKTTRLSNLLQFLLDRILQDSSNFHLIIDIVRSMPELKHLADRLQRDVSLWMIQ